MGKEKATETKQERFKRILPKRVANALHALDLVQKCGDRSRYEYSEADKEKIGFAIQAKLIELGKAYEPPEPKTRKPRDQFEFNLDDPEPEARVIADKAVADYDAHQGPPAAEAE